VAVNTGLALPRSLW